MTQSLSDTPTALLLYIAIIGVGVILQCAAFVISRLTQKKHRAVIQRTLQKQQQNVRAINAAANSAEGRSPPSLSLSDYSAKASVSHFITSLATVLVIASFVLTVFLYRHANDSDSDSTRDGACHRTENTDDLSSFYKVGVFCAPSSVAWLVHTVLLVIASVLPWLCYGDVYSVFLTVGGFEDAEGKTNAADPYPIASSLYWIGGLRSGLRASYYLGLCGSLLPIAAEVTRAIVMLRFDTEGLVFVAGRRAATDVDDKGSSASAAPVVAQFAASVVVSALLLASWCRLMGVEWLVIGKVLVLFRKMPDLASTIADTNTTPETPTTAHISSPSSYAAANALSLDYEMLPLVARREMRLPHQPYYVHRSILRTLWRRWRGAFAVLSAMRLFQESLGLIPALLLRDLVDGVVSRKDFSGESDSSDADIDAKVLEANIRHGVAIVAGLILCSLLSTFIRTHYDLKHSKIGLYCKAVLSDAVYSHSASLKPFQRVKPKDNANNNKKEKKGTDTDKEKDASDKDEYINDADVINHLLVDVPRICDQVSNLNNIWCLPAQIGFALYLLYVQIGWGFLAGLVLTIAMVPTNALLCKKIGKINVAMMKANDARVGAVTEVIANIKFVKMCGWSDAIFDRIAVPRKEFMQCLAWVKYLDGVCAFFWASTPVLVSLASFITYAGLFHGVLTPGKVIASLALFNTLILPLNSYPWVLNGAVEAWVSLKRLESFLHDYTPDIMGEHHSAADDEDDDISSGNRLFPAPSTLDAPSGTAAAASALTLGSKKRSVPIIDAVNIQRRDGSRSVRQPIVIKNIVIKRGGGGDKKDTKSKDDAAAAVSIQSTDESADSASHHTEAHADEPSSSQPSTFEVKLPNPLILKPGALTVLKGPTGGGKSSVLAGLSHEAAVEPLEGGSIDDDDDDDDETHHFSNNNSTNTNNNNNKSLLRSLIPPHLSIAYLPQEAFIMDTTVRRNILFHKAGDDEEKEVATHADAQHSITPPSSSSSSSAPFDALVYLRLLDSLLAMKSTREGPSASHHDGDADGEERLIPEAASEVHRQMSQRFPSNNSVVVGATAPSSPQPPHVQNNSCSTHAFHPDDYSLVLNAACLDADLTQWPMGDARRCGDRGDGLSGGQKHRVAFARALYCDADVYLIDDFLGALDSHVCSSIIRRGIANLLLKHNKIVLMVSEHEEVLALARRSGGSIYDVRAGVVGEGTHFTAEEWEGGDETPSSTASDDNAIDENDSSAFDSAFSSVSSFSNASPLSPSPHSPLTIRSVFTSLHRKRRQNAQKQQNSSTDINSYRLLTKEHIDLIHGIVSRASLSSSASAALGQPQQKKPLPSSLTPLQTKWLALLASESLTQAELMKAKASCKSRAATAAAKTSSKQHKGATNAHDEDEELDGETLARLAREEEEANKEIKETGSINIKVFFSYLLAMGIPLFFFVVAFLVGMQGVRNYSDVYVAMWAADHADDGDNADDNKPNASVLLGFPSLSRHTFAVDDNTTLPSPTSALSASSSSQYDDDVSTFLKFMGGLAAVNVVLAMVRGLGFAFAGLKACIVIHDDVVTRVIGAPFIFFSTIPRGRLINRLSRDIYCVDESLPFMFNIFLAQLFMLIGAIVVIGITSSFAVLGGAIPIVVILYIIQRPYRRVNREMKRLESAARSPIVDHLRTLLEGGAIMRCLGVRRCVSYFIERAFSDYSIWHKLNFNLSLLQWWFNLNMQLIGVGIVALVGILTVVVNREGSGGAAASMGLALAYVAPLTTYISNLLGSFTELEKLFISVERVEEYRALETEGHLFQQRQLLLRGKAKQGGHHDEGSKPKNKSKGEKSDANNADEPLLLDAAADEDGARRVGANAINNNTIDRGYGGRSSLGGSSVRSLSTIEGGEGRGGDGSRLSIGSSSPAAVGYTNKYTPLPPFYFTSQSIQQRMHASPYYPLHCLPHRDGDYKAFLRMLEQEWPFLGDANTSTNPSSPTIGGKDRAPSPLPPLPTIVFNNVSVRYSPNGPRVLKTITLTIPRHQKVALVGRTGSGKSSMVMSLLGLVPIMGSEDDFCMPLGPTNDREQKADDGYAAPSVMVKKETDEAVADDGAEDSAAVPFSPLFISPQSPNPTPFIAISGVMINLLDPEWMRRHVTVLPQECLVLEGTVYSNLIGFEGGKGEAMAGGSNEEEAEEKSSAKEATHEKRGKLSISEQYRRAIMRTVLFHLGLYTPPSFSSPTSLSSPSSPSSPSYGSSASSRFPSLFMRIEQGGRNVSAGERHLLSIARVVVSCFRMGTSDTDEENISEQRMRELLFPSSVFSRSDASAAASVVEPSPSKALPSLIIDLSLAPKRSKASIVIMDEPAASIDSESEERLWKLLEVAFGGGPKDQSQSTTMNLQGSTILAITHKLKSVVGGFFDRVLVLQKGVLIGDGSPQELQSKGVGPFAEMLHEEEEEEAMAEAEGEKVATSYRNREEA